MKIYDTVFHTKKRAIGKVLLFMKRNPGVLVDYSDETGIMCRWTHIKNLEVINENAQRRI